MVVGSSRREVCLLAGLDLVQEFMEDLRFHLSLFDHLSPCDGVEPFDDFQREEVKPARRRGTLNSVLLLVRLHESLEQAEAFP